jgi:hypothetical protein
MQCWKKRRYGYQRRNCVCKKGHTPCVSPFLSSHRRWSRLIVAGPQGEIAWLRREHTFSRSQQSMPP